MAQRPTGFVVLGMLCAFFTFLMGVAALSVPRLPPPTLTLAFLKLILPLLTVLGAVVAEALWCVRPWAYRASATLAITFIGTILALGAAEGGSGMAVALVAAVPAGLVTGAMVAYVRNRSYSLFPAPRPRPALAPRPRP
jgi:hypothetical protein